MVTVFLRDSGCEEDCGGDSESVVGIPTEIVDAIKVMYSSAFVFANECKTEPITIDTDVLQGDQLAPFLSIISLGYALRTSIKSSGRLTSKRRQSSRNTGEVLAVQDFGKGMPISFSFSLC